MHLKGTNSIGKIMAKIFDKIPQKRYYNFMLRSEDIIVKEEKFYLQKIGINGFILHTPGHTSGSLSLILENEKAFVGDLIMNLPFSSLKPLFAENLRQLYQSWNKILSYKIKILYPAHGKFVSIERFKKFAYKFLNNLKKLKSNLEIENY